MRRRRGFTERRDRLARIASHANPRIDFNLANHHVTDDDRGGIDVRGSRNLRLLSRYARMSGSLFK